MLQTHYYKAVFCNFFFEAETFGASIFIAHGTSSSSSSSSWHD